MKFAESLLLAILFTVPLQAATDPFAERYAYYLAHPAVKPIAKAHHDEDLHYVFVTGFLGEFMYGYFRDQIAELHRLGVAEDHIRMVVPTSWKSTEAGAEKLRQSIVERPGKVVVISHSFGGIVAVTLAMSHPNLVDKQIKAIYVLNGSLGGSYWADEVLHSRPSFDNSKLPWLARITLVALRFQSRALFLPVFRSGLQSQERETRQRTWQKLAAENPLAKAALASKLRYLTTYSEESDPLFRRTGQYGINDGLVLVKDQVISGMGKMISELPARHMEFVLPLGSKLTLEQRHALMTAIYSDVETPSPALNNFLKIAR